MNFYKYYFSKKTLIFLLLVCLLKSFLFVMVFSGQVCTEYKGFSVDKEENLYIGMPSVVKVYSAEGEYLRSFSPKTSRGYNFTIKDGDTVFIDTGDKLYTLDLYGNVLDVYEGDYSKIKYANKFTSESGNEYVARNNLLRTTVVSLSDGYETEVFKMPVLDYTVKLLEYTTDILFFFFIVLTVIRQRRLA